MIEGPANCVPTLRGWQREDGRIIVRWDFTQEQIDEWHAAQGEQMLTEADPTPTLETLNEGDLEDMTKLELEALGRENGVELDRRKNKSTLINTMKGILKRT
tara:strand:- start:433 stop:738 length:306 start_codon:yes stop_codon:yes gene_type:complete